jgi:hypothetical protein
MRFAIPMLLALTACSDPPASPRDPTPEASLGPAAPANDDLGDPLLATARRAITRGELADPTRAQLASSADPRHVRAAALLAALDNERPAPRRPAPEPDAPPRATVAIPVTAPPADAPAHDSSAPESAASPAGSRPAEPRPAAPRRTATLEKLSLRGSGGKSTLSIDAGQGMVVGVAAQPGAGLVRLVIKDVRASAAVLAARPKAAGARVVDVDAGPSSVRITLSLDDGWHVVTTRRTATGAKVELAQS